MADWQFLATYNKIAPYTIIVFPTRMPVQPSEIDCLNSLDSQAITALHNRYYPEVYRFARFRVSDEHVAEDIACEVFARLLEAVHAGHGPHTNLRGWLHRTAANIVNDHFRKVYNQPKDDPPEILENNVDLFLSQSDPAGLSDDAERKRLLQSAINELTEAQKMVITLRFGSQFSLEETAVLMGKNVNTIKGLQFRALAALREKLGSNWL